jgi:hypothetical protein
VPQAITFSFLDVWSRWRRFVGQQEMPAHTFRKLAQTALPGSTAMARCTYCIARRCTVTDSYVVVSLRRLAASDSLDEHAPFSVGVPSWLRESSDPGPGRNYFFMHIRPADVLLPRQPPLVHSSRLQFGPRLMGPSPIPNLVLGPLLGKVSGCCTSPCFVGCCCVSALGVCSRAGTTQCLQPCIHVVHHVVLMCLVEQRSSC